MQRKYMIAFCVVAALTSCDSTDPESLPVCGVGVTLTVSSGTTPTFDWNPSCRVGGLIIEEIGGSDLWLIFGVNMTNAIAPGVTYGLVPEGAVQNAPREGCPDECRPVQAQPLSPGTTYQMAIAVFEPEGQDENFEIVATATFTQ